MERLAIYLAPHGDLDSCHGHRRREGRTRCDVGWSAVNRAVFALYVTSAMTVFPAALLLIAGLVIRLQAS